MVQRYVVNDNLHSQLSNAGRPAQAHIDETPTGPMAYGKVKALEIESQEGLTDFTMGGNVTGVCWSINPYVGCLHACRYCYVPNTVHVERNRWGTYVVAKHNLPQVLRKELKRRKPMTTYLSTATDPYQAPERIHGITRACLRLLARHDWPVDVLTRSPLVLRDLDLLQRFTRLRVGMSVPTMDDAARRLLEPAAPPIGARLRALGRLTKAGIPVYANYTPAYPPTGFTASDVAENFAKAGVQWVNTTEFRRVPSYLGKLWDDTHKTEWSDLARFIADPKRQEQWFRDISRHLTRAGIAVRTSFYNPPFDLTKPYEETRQMRLETEEARPLTSLPNPWWAEPALPMLTIPR